MATATSNGRSFDMADSPSHRWENGVLAERAIETNRWKILPDGTAVEDTDAEPKPRRKAVSSAKTENKSVKQADET